MDCPGIDDQAMAKDVKDHLLKFKSQIIPIFIISSASGEGNRNQFNYIKEIIGEMKNFYPTVIFT